MAVQRTVQLLASKLSLADNEKVICKAAEFERLLHSKSLAGSNLTDTAKIVICLDLAAAFFGVHLDLKAVIKYSGLKSQSYLSGKKTIENLLEINTEILTVPSLCITLQCTNVQELAERILKGYQVKLKMEIDLSLPQYVCMAVYQACRQTKVKISKSKIMEKSRLKPAQWAKLDADWTKYVDENMFIGTMRKKAQVNKNCVEEIATEENMEVDSESTLTVNKSEIEPYQEWKRRILNAAYKELEELKKIESIEKKNTRKSPRKTPLKFSPYKNSPKKEQAVRLLFPLN